MSSLEREKNLMLVIKTSSKSALFSGLNRSTSAIVETSLWQSLCTTVAEVTVSLVCQSTLEGVPGISCKVQLSLKGFIDPA